MTGGRDVPHNRKHTTRGAHRRGTPAGHTGQYRAVRTHRAVRHAGHSHTGQYDTRGTPGSTGQYGHKPCRKTFSPGTV